MDAPREPGTGAPRSGFTRTVIYDAHDFTPLTVTDLPGYVWDYLWESDKRSYKIQVHEPESVPNLAALCPDLRLPRYVHHAVLCGLRISLDRHRTLMLVVTETPKLALWLPPAQLRGQHRTEEDLAREAFEAGLRDGARLKGR